MNEKKYTLAGCNNGEAVLIAVSKSVYNIISARRAGC